MMRRAAIAVVAVLLASCGGAPVPDQAYYKLPLADSVAALPEAAFAEPILVDTFLADGLHDEQAILYSTSEGGSIKAYHYQLWNDPPVRLLQRRLIARLRDAGITSNIVADRVPSQLTAMRVSGFIERFERQQTETGWIAAVKLEMRVDVGTNELPVLLRTYESLQPADNDSIQATIRAFAAAVDDVFARFVDDFAKSEG
ncbi:MAG TPA: ABC-type transport auxiliary lipoprotein family protein [Xanthomonadales bacterium]|nr:ABC-type transport auxiliary lipoprotein family protein [Xanthomonadales bacterium]